MENLEICSRCGGQCCKSCGCHFSPQDFENVTFNSLKREINKGYISIDIASLKKIIPHQEVYFLRMRNVGAPVVDFGNRRRSQCILLTPTGCIWDYEHRPTGGRLLIPSPDGNCYSKYNIRLCCYEWRFHQDVLEELVRYFL